MREMADSELRDATQGGLVDYPAEGAGRFALDGGPGELTADTALPAAAERLASETEPEIIVESGDELGLRHFFLNPLLWGVALIPMLFIAITSYITAVRVSDGFSPLGRGTIYEDMFFQPPSISFFARWLLPFGTPMTTDTGYGYGLTYMLQTNFIVGLVALLIGLLIVMAVTRKTSDAVYVAGPYFIYSMCAVIYLKLGGEYYQTVGDLFPALLGALFVPILAGIVAKIVGVYLRNIGWLEADAGLSTIDVEENAAMPTWGLAPAADGSQAHAAAASASGAVSDSPATGAQAEEAAKPSWKHVDYAVACPFCGNPKIAHKHPGTCSRCHRNIGVLLEVEGHTACPRCEGVLVKDAAFCHHCGWWQKGDAEAPAELRPA